MSQGDHIGPTCYAGPLGEPAWFPISTMPNYAGFTFEVQDEKGDVYLARYSAGRVRVDADWPVEPTHWRPVRP